MAGRADVLIVGGGVAGLATAIHLGRAGCRVTVLEQTPLPRDKVCGEGLMPRGLSLLRGLGIDPEALAGAGFSGMDYRTRHTSARLDLPSGVHGRGIPRTVLIEALNRAAGGLDGVTLEHGRARELLWEGSGEARRIVGVGCEYRTGVGGEVRAEFRAGVVVAADGVHSGLARLAGLRFHGRGERYALRRHFTLPTGLPALGIDGLGRVGVALVREGPLAWDVYLTPVGPRTLLATTMTDAAGLRSIRGDYPGFLERSPFGDWFTGAMPSTRLLGWRHPLFVPERYHVGGMLLVGDAGGGADPCLGVGMTLALAGAELAAQVIPAGLAGKDAAAAPGPVSGRVSGERALEAFDRGRKNIFRHFNAFDKIFRLIVRSRMGGEALVGAMGLWPEVADGLLAIVGAGQPWREFPWAALMRPCVRGRKAREGV